MQAVPIITKDVSLIPAHGQVYLIQLYVMKFVSDVLPDQWFSLGTPISSNIIDCHDIAEILLKISICCLDVN